MSDWTVVGLCGVTNSGKTSLSRGLEDRYPGSICLSQDSYFFPVDYPGHIPSAVPGHLNWDVMSALDMDRMLEDVLRILGRSPVAGTESGLLILEGFLLLAHRELSQLCDIKIYLELDYEETLRRRLTRRYDPPDPPGYFQEVVWPEAVRARADILKLHQSTGLILLSGRNSLVDNLNIICDKINNHIKVKKT